MLEFQYSQGFKKELKQSKGKWSGHREFHIEPDWLVVYRIENNDTLILVTIGTHSELFQ